MKNLQTVKFMPCGSRNKRYQALKVLKAYALSSSWSKYAKNA
jgi:hypothetical protein